jgi:hypothetical protein
MKVIFHDTGNLGVSLFFPAFGFAFIGFMATMDVAGSMLLAGSVAFVPVTVFYVLWRKIVRSIASDEQSVLLETNCGAKKVNLVGEQKISVIRGPLSKSVLIFVRDGMSWKHSVFWSAFGGSNVGDYESTVREIKAMTRK